MKQAARTPGPSLQPVVIAAGTPITCEVGHTICVTATDYHANEALAVEMFTKWQTAAPRVGDLFPRCNVSGQAAYRDDGNGPELHTHQGWRSLTDAAKLGVATKSDVDNAVTHLDAKMEAMRQRFEAVLWKHTAGIILNVLVIAGVLIWLFR